MTQDSTSQNCLPSQSATRRSGWLTWGPGALNAPTHADIANQSPACWSIGTRPSALPRPGPHNPCSPPSIRPH